MPVLHTKHLTLSPCSPSDRADFIALELDPEVMHFLNSGAVDHENTDPNDVTFLMPRGTEPYVWTARRTINGEFVGWLCLFSETQKLAEIGYRLCRKSWGQGLASEAASGLLNWGFSVAGYDKIEACTLAANHGSRRVMEKIGMDYSRTVPTKEDHSPGGEQSEVWYELTRSKWSNR